MKNGNRFIGYKYTDNKKNIAYRHVYYQKVIFSLVGQLKAEI